MTLSCIAENGVYICVDKVTPVPTQCVQIIQPIQTVIPPDTINVLINGVQQVTYYSEPYHNSGIFLAIVIAFIFGAFVGWIFLSE